jgi:hypothetical protein
MGFSVDVIVTFYLPLCFLCQILLHSPNGNELGVPVKIVSITANALGLLINPRSSIGTWQHIKMGAPRLSCLRMFYSG